MHYHFDPVGGIAGDMFVGAMLDMRPELADGAINAVRIAGIEPKVTLKHVAFTDGVLSGSKFEVGIPEPEPHHHHVHWSALRKRLQQSALEAAVGERAVAIFAVLAEAEAKVHDKPVEDVVFHEVGAWDSIADIVAAAYLIEALTPCTWSVGSIPIGSGRVRTDHGLLPVPAPATTLLLEGFDCFDDGFKGERVTPTGAAIIRNLAPAHGVGSIPRVLKNNGYGFGTRRFEGMSNVLRVLEFEQVPAETTITECVAVINFEVDDQTAEDLAFGLDQLRNVDGVIDVIQTAALGKQGRLASSVQILADPANADRVTDACFRETTTIGLRIETRDRLILNRREVATSDNMNVKIADRPGQPTAKADLRGASASDGHAGRDRLRRKAEIEALSTLKNER